jgi:hypothetical protein
MRLLDSRLWRRMLVLVIAGLVTFGNPLGLRAQDDGADDSDATVEKAAAVPLVIINAASVDRLLGDVRYLFETAGQSQLNESIENGLAAANNLEGVNRDKPLGMMIFLAPGFPPTPIPVTYVPVDDIDKVAQLIGGGNTQLKPVDGEPDRYELVGGRRGTQQVVLRGGYAFINQSAENLDQKFLDPVKLTSGLSARHDLAVTLRLDTVPDAVKTTLLGVLRAQFNANMQQRDDEPDGPYQLRRANESNALEFIELLLAEGNRVTLGINASEEDKDAVLEVQFEAKPSGNWAKALAKIDSRPSYFSPLLDEKAPLSFSLSWKMDDREQGNMTEFLRVLEPQVASQLEPVEPAVRSLFSALTKTAETGHADAFFQYKVMPPERMALFGGVKVEDGQKLSTAVRSILSQLKMNPDVGEMEIDIDAHKGVSFHRIGSRSETTTAANQRIYGGTPSVYIGTGPNVVWFSLGDSSSLDATKTAIDDLAEARATVGKKVRGAPFQFVLNMSNWLEKLDSEGTFAKLARPAFEGGKDRLQVDIRPSENGMRLQLRVEEGYLKLLGSAIGTGIQRRQERREERRRRRAAEGGDSPARERQP